jgi:hypothetical protein
MTHKHTMPAKRYIAFCTAMDSLLPLSKDLLQKRLGTSISTRPGTECIRTALKDRDKPTGNPRIGIPNRLITLITSQDWKPPARAKVPASWVAAWLANIRPRTDSNWESQQLSHLCRTGDCINPKHLHFESARVNQQRGQRLCLARCRHCSDHLCMCQDLHKPPCVP